MTADANTAAVGLVLTVLRSVLGEEPALTPGTALFEVPGFDSLALAAVVERLEDELGPVLPDELLVPESFATPDDIAAVLVAPALRAQHGGVPS
ncbi:acyl carrier protein [Actinomadura sp. NPDC047616]|uniref:acyl carrier protein n=1 Tax=Actinomadura sp. NPDC047616 TaxID=3155914 RepID=UPI0034051CB4